MRIYPYLNFGGDCREAFEFYAEVLGGCIVSQATFAEMGADGDMGPDWKDKVMNIHLVADGAEIMGSDAPPQYYSAPAGMTASIVIDDDARAQHIFARLKDGARMVMMDLSPTPWARLFGMVTDRFGTPWMISSGLSGSSEA